MLPPTCAHIPKTVAPPSGKGKGEVATELFCDQLEGAWQHTSIHYMQAPTINLDDISPGVRN